MIVDLSNYQGNYLFPEIIETFKKEFVVFKNYKTIKKFYKERIRESHSRKKDLENCNIDQYEDDTHPDVDWLIVLFYHHDKPKSIDKHSKKLFKNTRLLVSQLPGIYRCGFTIVAGNNYVPEHFDEDDRDTSKPVYNVLCTIKGDQFFFTTNNTTLQLTDNTVIGLDADQLHSAVNKSNDNWIALALNIERRFIDH